MKTKEGKPPIDIGICEGEGLFEMSVSRAKRWKACQQSHDYKYVQKLIPKVKKRPLSLGSLVHACLERRAEDKNWVQTIQDFKTSEWSKLFEEERVELGDIPGDAYRIMRGYHYYYLNSDKRYEVVAVEQPFRIRVQGTPVVIVGIIDLIVRDLTDNGIWIFEHKTAKRDIPTEEFRMTDIQTTVYRFAAIKLADALGYKPHHVRGVILDYLKTKPPTIPQILKDGTLSKRKIVCDYYTYLECIKKVGGNPDDYTEILEYMKTNVFYKRIPITKCSYMTKTILEDMVNTGLQIKAISGKCPVRNLAWTCDRPTCDYRDLCIAEIQGLDVETLINLKYERREDEDGKESDGDTE